MRWLKAIVGFSVVVAPTAIFGLLPLTGLLNQEQARWATLTAVVWFVLGLLAVGVIAFRSSPPNENEVYQKGLRDGVGLVLDRLRESGPIEVEPRVFASATGDTLEIRDEATATVTRATVNEAGDLIVEPPSRTPLVDRVVRVFPGVARLTVTAHNPTVIVSPSEAPQSPESSKHD